MSKRTASENVFDKVAETDATDESAPAEQDSRSETVDESVSETAGATEAGTDEAADDRPSGKPRRRIGAAAVGLVVVTALASAGLLGWRLKQADDTGAAGRAALDAARNYAIVLTTLDTTDIDKNFQQALDGATGEFKNEYSQGSSQLRQILIDNNASGTGVVVDAAVKSATKTKVDVLLFVDQSVTNTLNPSPRIDRNRVRMTMELVDNRWLASKVEII
ncbi:Mce protein [Mycobacterium spongiae]|uniref:Mce protein n=1 Tax=Mycobacterium spongiae TaxID=886343 RepID=A0A975JYH6_9MYCO|nr:Mce protein [Mycobacterium spongiae]QUR67743.1 Mce protein [Mycobacterium spongiae]